MIISHDHRFIFVHIGRTGGTSVEKTLCGLLGLDIEKTLMDQQGNWWKHIWAKDLRQRFGEEIWNSYFTFSFTRNPYDMILSLYSMYTQCPQYTDPRDQFQGYPNLR